MKLELLKHQIELSRILINEILETEVKMLSGEKYSHKKPNEGRYSRWGYNPGSVRIGSEKVPIDIPRVIPPLLVFFANKEHEVSAFVGVLHQQGTLPPLLVFFTNKEHEVHISPKNPNSSVPSK